MKKIFTLIRSGLIYLRDLCVPKCPHCKVKMYYTYDEQTDLDIWKCPKCEHEFI